MALPSDEFGKKVIKDAMFEISASMTRIEGERDYIKESIAKVCEEFELSKKTFRKLVRTYHKQNYDKEIAEHEEFETMYEELTGQTTSGVAHE